LLSVSRKQPIKLESIDLNGWMTVTLSLINAAVGERIKLLTNVAADIWCVRADPMELEFALVNVAVNARDAMQAGGQFSIDCRNIRVEDPAMGLPPGEYVLITLTDDGDGMPATVLQRAFEPLFTTKERGSGTGLGLPQVLAACEQAGGSARIESRLGEGTRVMLYLPRYVSGIPATNEINVASGQALPEVDKTVLLVEDNEGVAAGIEAVLETFGCTVRHVTTGDAAHTVLEHGNVFDLVLSDIQMPGKLSGIDLAELVRKKWPDQRIALMTGYADELARVEKMDVKVYAKPFDMNELRSFIYEDA
jgi:CheY-like chemotaxis protein